jgi:uracil-DNA glycosylase
MRHLIPDDWRAQLTSAIDSDDFSRLSEFVAQQRLDHPDGVFPPAAEVFAALDLTPFEAVRAVILGMDPYFKPGQAHGLAFSIRPGSKPFPTSLRNVLNELERDLGEPVNRGGSLIPWARNGVLLLNTGMTVRAGTPGSHLRNWRFFTDAVIQAVARKPDPVAFLLWGRHAQAKAQLLEGGPHLVLKSSHPTGYSAHIDFTGTSPFSRANEELQRVGRPDIDWRLPPD